MKIDQCTKDAINDRSEVVFKAYGVELHKGRAKCPFHDDKHASFLAKSDKAGRWKWKCLACETKGGDIFSFVAKMEGLNKTSDFPEVVKYAASACNLSHLLSQEDEEENKESDEAEQQKRINRKQEQVQEEPPRYFNIEAESMAQEIEQTNLYKFLCRLWDANEVKRVMRMYLVGRGHYINAPKSKFNASDDWAMNPRPCRLQNSLASNSFPSIDNAGNVHAIKIIPYPLTDHHRIKDAQPDKAELYWIKPEQNPGSYFGTHLLTLRPAAPVAVVESEKSAIIGALFAPQYVWIAVQSKTEFKPGHKLEALVGRTLHIFPDTDGMMLWREQIAALTSAGYVMILRDEVMKLFPAESKLDIADVIIWEMERRANNG